MERTAEDGAAAARVAARAPQFPLAKFRPPPLPRTLVTRPALRDWLTAGAGKRLTVAVGPAGAGKSVLLADWAAARPAGSTAWLSCDGADADPVRFWAGFIEAPRAIETEFGGDAVDLLGMDGRVSADFIALVANDAAKLPEGSAIVVDDFHLAVPGASSAMADLVECWPAETVQLVLASRGDPPLRMHRMRMSGELREIRDRDMYFSLDDSRRLLANFGVELPDADLGLLQRRSEGWPAAVQMVALSLRGAGPSRAAQALQVHAIGEYFVDEVLSLQPPQVTRFMLDTSVLDELTVEACAAVTARQDAAALLHGIDAADLFLVALDEDRAAFRYHHLVSQALRAELRARDPARERLLQLRAGEWFESAGDARRAARHFIAARQSRRALALLRDKSVAGFLRDPVQPAPLDVRAVRPELITDAPDELLALATDLLLAGDITHGGQCLDLFDRTPPQARLEPALEARLAVARAFRFTTLGQLARALGTAMRARAMQDTAHLGDEWTAAVSWILLNIYPCLEAPDAVEREAVTTLRIPRLDEPARLVLVPGARALALVESGRLAEGSAAALAAQADAVRLGFHAHLFAVDHLRALAGLACERLDLDAAEDLAGQVLAIAERWQYLLKFLALLDRAKVAAARGQIREALAMVASARQELDEPSSALVARADEQEALLRLALGDPRSPAELAGRMRPGARRDLLLARIALAAGDHVAAQRHLRAVAPGDLTPRRGLEREILLAAAAIERGDPATASILGVALHTARRLGFLGTVVTTAPQVTDYLIEHAVQLRADPFIERLITAAVEVRAAQPAAAGPGRVTVEPLTDAERRVLRHLPTSSYAQIADTLYISRNTVKTHLRSIYRKLGAQSRAQALERALELRLL